MLDTKSQTHKENDDMTPENNSISDDDCLHEDIEVDIVVSHVGFVNKHNEKRKFTSKGNKDHSVKICGVRC